MDSKLNYFGQDTRCQDLESLITELLSILDQHGNLLVQHVVTAKHPVYAVRDLKGIAQVEDQYTRYVVLY